MNAGEGVALLAVAAFPFVVLFLVAGGAWVTHTLGWWR